MYRIKINNNILLIQNITRKEGFFIYSLNYKNDKFEFVFEKNNKSISIDNTLIENKRIKYFYSILTYTNDFYNTKTICFRIKYDDIILYETKNYYKNNIILENNKICYYNYSKLLIIDYKKECSVEYKINHKDFSIENVIELSDGKLLLASRNENSNIQLYIHDIYSNNSNSTININNENIICLSYSNRFLDLESLFYMQNLLIFFPENSIITICDLKHKKIINYMIFEKEIYNLVKVNNKKILNIKCNEDGNKIKFEYSVISIVYNNIKNMMVYDIFFIFN